MATTREGVGRLRTSSGMQCRANYTMKSVLTETGKEKTEGWLCRADPDVALDSFKPGSVAVLELGSGDTLQIDITGILPGDEVTFVVHHGIHKKHLRD